MGPGRRNLSRGLSLIPLLPASGLPPKRRLSAIAMSQPRLAGVTPDGAARRVRLVDGDARPIANGRLGHPAELGCKAQVTGNDDGVIVRHVVEQGNPAGAPQLAPAVERVIQRTGRRPRTVTADRGVSQAYSETQTQVCGARDAADPAYFGRTLRLQVTGRSPSGRPACWGRAC